MKRGTKSKLVLKSSSTNPEIWDFYRQLDSHIKRDFAFEIMNRLDWTKSTFYRRLSEGYNWSTEEVRVVNMIYRNYKTIYG